MCGQWHCRPWGRRSISAAEKSDPRVVDPETDRRDDSCDFTQDSLEELQDQGELRGDYGELLLSVFFFFFG